MEIHHDRHHAAYVTNLNKAVAGFPDVGKKSIEDLTQALEFSAEIQSEPPSGIRAEAISTTRSSGR